MGRYVGIDPSTKTGIVILHDSGRLIMHTEYEPKTKQEPQRFLDIASEVLICLQKGDKVMIEGFSYGSKGQGVSTQYGIGWTVRTELVKAGYEYIEVTPTGLKKFVTNKGNTKKENMILPINDKWGYRHDSDNVRDAFCLAQVGRYLDGLETPTKYQEDVLKKLKGA